MQLKIWQKFALVVLIPLFVELLFVPVLATIFVQIEQQSTEQLNGQLILMEATNISRNFNDFSRVLSGYTLTRAPFFKDRCYQLMTTLRTSIDQLDALSRQSKVQPYQLTLLKSKMTNALSLLSSILSETDSADEATLRRTDSFRQIHSVQEAIETDLNGFIKSQQAAAEVNMRKATELRKSLEVWSALAIAVQVIVVGILVLTFSRGMAQGLRRLTESTHRMLKNEPVVLPVDGKDEIGQLSRVFQQMSDALLEANKKRQELIAIVSHDLRSPLSSLAGVFSLFKTGMLGELNERGTSSVKNAESTIARLIGLINDLLDMHKMETGNFDLNLQQVDVNDLMQQSVSVMEIFAGQKEVKLVSTECSLHAHADPDRLMQVLVNLISNAIKFSPADTTITVSAKPVDGFVEMSVADQGRGIPPDDAARIFHKYEQVERRDNQNLRGSGIGLWICKAMVEAHGGTIDVESKVGEGSRFWFRVPQEHTTSSSAPQTEKVSNEA